MGGHAAARRLLLVLALLPLWAAGQQGGNGTAITVALQVETLSVDRAASVTGADFSFEVNGTWQDYEVLCERQTLSEKVEVRRDVGGWPTRVRLRARTQNGLIDEWGLRRILLTDLANSRVRTVLSECDGDACLFGAANSGRWVTSATDMLFDIPPLDATEWHVGAWGTCCCPVADPLLSSCAPGQRVRQVTCPGGGALCNVSPQPLASQACEDHAECPYETMCPLGRDLQSLDCQKQAWILLAVVLLLFALVGGAVRFCHSRWLLRLCCASGPAAPKGGGEEAEPKPTEVVPTEAAPADLEASAASTSTAPTACQDPPGFSSGQDFGAKDAVEKSVSLPLWQTGGVVSLDSLPTAGSELIGTWRYSVGAGASENKYIISRHGVGPLQLTGNISTGQRVTCILQQRGIWHVSSLVRSMDSNEDIGIVRMRFLCNESAILSNFQIPGDNLWGPDMLAYKVEAEYKLSGNWDDAKGPVLQPGTSPDRWPMGKGELMDLADLSFKEKPLEHVVLHRRSVVPTGGLCMVMGCWSDASAEICGEGDISLATIDNPPPAALQVESLNKHQSCTGEYRLLDGERPNGFPAWEKLGGGRWLYTGTDSKWYIGGQSSRNKNFDCASGFIFRDFRHFGMTPDVIGGPWEYGDGSEWHMDGSIKITALTKKMDDASEKDFGYAQPEADPSGAWWPKVDSPGKYVVVHANSAVTAASVTAPPVLAQLPLGTIIQVKEVVYRTEDMRVRGRIESPVAGWISIRDLEDGYQWARKREEDELSTEEGGSSGRSRIRCSSTAPRAASKGPAPAQTPPPPSG